MNWCHVNLQCFYCPPYQHQRWLYHQGDDEFPQYSQAQALPVSRRRLWSDHVGYDTIHIVFSFLHRSTSQLPQRTRRLKNIVDHVVFFWIRILPMHYSWHCSSNEFHNVLFPTAASRLFSFPLSEGFTVVEWPHTNVQNQVTEQPHTNRCLKESKISWNYW